MLVCMSIACDCLRSLSMSEVHRKTNSLHDKAYEQHQPIAQPSQIDPDALRKLFESVNGVHRDLKSYANSQVNTKRNYQYEKF
jgi:hypothetical protein